MSALHFEMHLCGAQKDLFTLHHSYRTIGIDVFIKSAEIPKYN